MDTENARAREALEDLKTDLEDLRDALSDAEGRHTDQLIALQGRVERIQRILSDHIYAVEDRVRRLENSR